MPTWAQTTLTGWGRVQRAQTLAARPERVAEVQRALLQTSDTVIAYGAGRSYGDTALNTGGRTIITSRLDRMLAFDPSTRLLVAEPGVMFGDLVRIFAPIGFMPPVVPGTGFATLAGGIANDVHGKNHHQVGSLGQHIEYFDLRIPTGELKRVKPDNDGGLFKATVGGLGLTGVIEQVGLRMSAVASDAVHAHKRRIANLEEFLRAFEEEKQRSNYVVGWIDALATGSTLGRGILETAIPAPNSVGASRRKPRAVPIDFPGFALNSTSVRAFNWLYRRHVAMSGSDATIPYEEFLFPLDALHHWNRVYGKRGFRQFQCVVPFDSGHSALRKLLEAIAKAGRGSFLAVLKAMGESGVGYLSFPMPGYTLALDFPNSPGVVPFVRELENIVLDHGGRVYLAKDSTLTADVFRRMYPAHTQQLALLQQIDPHQRMRSDLAARIGLKGGLHA